MDSETIQSADLEHLPRGMAHRLGQIVGAGGQVPPILQILAQSPVTLRSLWNQISAARQMSLPSRTRQAIGLRVAELNGSTDTDSSLLELVGEVDLGPDETASYRSGRSEDSQEQTLLALATKLVKDRGHHARYAVDAARELGVSDEQLIEVIALVSLYTFVSYITNVATTLDRVSAGGIQ